MYLPFKSHKNLWRSVIPSGQDPGSLGPILCSAPPEIGSGIFPGLLDIRCVEVILTEVGIHFIPTTFWENKKGTGKKSQGLEDICLQYLSGAAMWPSCLSDQSSRSCLCREPYPGVDGLVRHVVQWTRLLLPELDES